MEKVVLTSKSAELSLKGEMQLWQWKLKLTGLKGFVGENELACMAPLVKAAQDTLHAARRRQ